MTCQDLGEDSAVYIVASHKNWGHTIKERICFHRCTFMPLRVDATLGRLRARIANRKSRELSPFENMAEKDGDVSIHLKCIAHYNTCILLLFFVACYWRGKKT